MRQDDCAAGDNGGRDRPATEDQERIFRDRTEQSERERQHAHRARAHDDIGGARAGFEPSNALASHLPLRAMSPD